jgi:hypothetical protein
MLRTWLGFSVLFAIFLILQGCEPKECKVRALESVENASGDLKAVLNENSCEGYSVADSSTSQSVSIVRQRKAGTGEAQLNGGLVFAMDAEERPDAKATVRWLSDSKLEISVSRGARIGTWITTMEGVDVLVTVRP